METEHVQNADANEEEDKFEDARGYTDQAPGDDEFQDLPEIKLPVEKRFLKSIEDFGVYKEFQGGAPEDDLKMHPNTHPTGGIVMADEEKVIPAAIKEMSKKVLGSLIKGKLHDLTKTPTPSYIHHPVSYLGLTKNDMTHCRVLKEAANTPDSLERMKLVIKYYIAQHCYNPTLLQCRAPLNPIIGETY
jgi:hypothetical protein